MKKIITLLVTIVMCINLVACGGIDTQPAIDSYNTLTENYNQFVDLVNAAIDDVDPADIDFMNQLATSLDEYGTKLSDGTEFTQEEVDEMVEMFDELNDVVVDAINNWG